MIVWGLFERRGLREHLLSLWATRDEALDELDSRVISEPNDYGSAFRTVDDAENERTWRSPDAAYWVRALEVQHQHDFGEDGFNFTPVMCRVLGCETVRHRGVDRLAQRVSCPKGCGLYYYDHESDQHSCWDS